MIRKTNPQPMTPQELADYIRQATDDQLEILLAWFDQAKERAVTRHDRQLADLLDYRNERSAQITEWRDSQLEALATLNPDSPITLDDIDPMPTPYVTGEITIKNAVYRMATKLVMTEPTPQVDQTAAPTTDQFSRLKDLINRQTEQRLNQIITAQLTSLTKAAQSQPETKFGPADFPPLGAKIGNVIIGAGTGSHQPPQNENPTGTWWVYASNPPSWIQLDTIPDDSPLADQPVWYGSPYGPKYPTTSWLRRLEADRANYPHSSYGDCHHLPGWNRAKCCQACHDNHRNDTRLVPIDGLFLCCKAATHLASSAEFFMTDKPAPDPDPLPDPRLDSNMATLAAIYEDLPHYYPCPNCQIPMDLTTSTSPHPGYLAEWQCPRCGFTIPHYPPAKPLNKNLTDSTVEPDKPLPTPPPTCPDCQQPLLWDDGSPPAWVSPELPPCWFCKNCGYERWADEIDPNTGKITPVPGQLPPPPYLTSNFASQSPNIAMQNDQPTGDQPEWDNNQPADNQSGAKMTGLEAETDSALQEHSPIQAEPEQPNTTAEGLYHLDSSRKIGGNNEPSAAAKRGIAMPPPTWLLYWVPILVALVLLVVLCWPR